MPKHPNILVFLPDGMQAQTAFPESDCQTPNLDRLARRGLRFRRAHTVLPTCSPARASLMTGLLPHNHGVLQVEHCVDADQSGLRTNHPHWAQRLSDSGYHTGYFGKWHIERSNRLENFGWKVNGCNENAAFRSLGSGIEKSESLLSENCLARFETLPEGYNAVLHYGVTEVPGEDREFASATRLAQRFLSASMGKEQPWACCVSYAEPNVPLVAGRAAFEQYDIENIELPENRGDEFPRSPAFYRRQKAIFSHLTDRQWRELRAVYYALITELDRELGKLLDQLETAGELDNTVVVVLSDHGRYVGGHGFDHHNFGAFEEIYRIPLIMAGPGIVENQETEALVSLSDLCPTLIELAGAQPIEKIDSRSFSRLLSDPRGEESTFCSSFAEYHGTRFTMQQRILWEGSWKFVFNGFDFDELYNLRRDPYELHNLAGEPNQQDRIKAMMGKIWAILEKTDDRSLLGTHYPPMRIAAVGPSYAKGK